MANDGENESSKSNISAFDAWYSLDGQESDVVLSTRVRLARDLANFPFPSRFREDDAERVRTMAFDAFSHLQEGEKYQAVLSSNLDLVGKRILCERGVIKQNTNLSRGSGIVIRDDGAFSCTVNDIDHFRLSAFCAGMNGVGAFQVCKAVDDELQDFMQFSANREQGFLTSRFSDCGSGMKISFRVHLPAISFSSNLQNIVEEYEKRGLGVRDCFGLSSEKSGALGSFYEFCTRCAGNGSEIDQLALISGALRSLVEKERRLSEKVFSSRMTEIRDRVYKSYALSKFSFLCDLRSAIEAISAIKWGKNLGILSGLSDGELYALVYRIQPGHIQFVMRNRDFSFPEDIAKSRALSEKHIRALLIQEAFGKIAFR